MLTTECVYLSQLWTHRDPEQRGGHGTSGLHEPHPPPRLRHPGQAAPETNTANILNVKYQNNSKHVFLFLFYLSIPIFSIFFVTFKTLLFYYFEFK